MKLRILLLTAFAILPLIGGEKEEEVKNLIEKAYIHGAFNEQNTEDMAAGFHSEFAIFSAKGEKLARYPIDKWIEGINKSKSEPKYDPKKASITHKISEVNVTGGAASAKIEIFRDGKQIYTDYLSLLHFDSGWKIVAKVYHSHK